jgi:hypothetical protein
MEIKEEKEFEQSDEVVNRNKAKEELKKEEAAQDVKEKANLKLDKLEKLDAKLKNATSSEILKPGYIPVRLSTKGLVGAPAEFHVRNFDTSDLMNLALSEQEDLPVKLVTLLDNLILEKDITTATFHEAEVIELVITIFRSFFSRYLKNLPYDLTDEDYEFQKKELGGENSTEYQQFIADLKSGKVKPHIDVDIDSLKYYPIDSNIKTIVAVHNDSLDAKFSFPKYGDLAVMKKFLDEEFREEDKKYASLMDILKIRQNAENKLYQGEQINFQSIPRIPQFEMDKLNDYRAEKGIVMVQALKVLHLVELDGQNLRNMSIGDRIKLVKDDARITHEILNQVTEFYQHNFKVGINTDEVTYLNPIQNKLVTTRLSFRLDTLLATIRDSRSDKTTISFE